MDYNRKDNFIAYLQACLDAEKAVAEERDFVRNVDNEIEKSSNLEMPKMRLEEGNRYEDPGDFDINLAQKIKIIAVAALSCGFTHFAVSYNKTLESRIILIKVTIAVLVILVMTVRDYDTWKWRKEDFDCKEAQKAAEQYAVFEDQMKDYRKKKASVDTLRVLLPEYRRLLDNGTDYLQKLYAYEVLIPKYQSMTCVAKLLEYLESGRADSKREALNLYEEENFRDQVIYHLGSIDTRLYSIEQTLQAVRKQQVSEQSVLMQMLKYAQKTSNAAQQSLEKLTNSVSRIERESAASLLQQEITAYTNNRMYLETVFQNRMEYGSAQKDTIFTTPVMRIYENPFKEQ